MKDIGSLIDSRLEAFKATFDDKINQHISLIKQVDARINNKKDIRDLTKLKMDIEDKLRYYHAMFVDCKQKMTEDTELYIDNRNKDTKYMEEMINQMMMTVNRTFENRDRVINDDINTLHQKTKSLKDMIDDVWKSMNKIRLRDISNSENILAWFNERHGPNMQALNDRLSHIENNLSGIIKKEYGGVIQNINLRISAIEDVLKRNNLM